MTTRTQKSVGKTTQNHKNFISRTEQNSIRVFSFNNETDKLNQVYRDGTILFHYDNNFEIPQNLLSKLRAVSVNTKEEILHILALCLQKMYDKKWFIMQFLDESYNDKRSLLLDLASTEGAISTIYRKNYIPKLRKTSLWKFFPAICKLVLPNVWKRYFLSEVEQQMFSFRSPNELLKDNMVNVFADVLEDASGDKRSIDNMTKFVFELYENIKTKMTEGIKKGFS